MRNKKNPPSFLLIIKTTVRSPANSQTVIKYKQSITYLSNCPSAWLLQQHFFHEALAQYYCLHAVSLRRKYLQVQRPSQSASSLPQPLAAPPARRESVRWRSFLISLLVLSAEQLHSMLSSYGRNNLPPPFTDRHSLQSSSSPISSLLSSHFSPTSLLPPSMTRLSSSSSPTREDPPFPYHPAAFASYQSSLKLKKKKQRTTKIGPDGIPLKRKSREGSTTYLWEFLLKLLQVRDNHTEQVTRSPIISFLLSKNDMKSHSVYNRNTNALSRTKNVVQSTSNGQTERRGSSSWWTARRSPDCGGSIRTNLTWTTRPWAELSGKSDHF